MSDLSAEIQLRPTRIGFLMHPADLASVRRIMRACTCLWGRRLQSDYPSFQQTAQRMEIGGLRALDDRRARARRQADPRERQASTYS